MNFSRRRCLALSSALLASVAWPACAFASLDGPPPPQQTGVAIEQPIIVTGPRQLRGAVPDVVPDRSLDASDLERYGAGSIRDILAEIAREERDEGEPILFVNGVPINDPEDIIDFPAEALERIDVLRSGTAARTAGAANRPTYNIVLKRVFGSEIVTLGHGFTTESGWGSFSGELNLSRIRDRRRLNLVLRASDESMLLESERGLLQPERTYPFASPANIIADPATGRSEIDPRLSAAAGRMVSVAAVPIGVSVPSLAQILAGANQQNESDFGAFRSLRSARRNLEIAANLTEPLNSWLDLVVNARAEQNNFRSLSGPRAGLFILPAEHPVSPFSQAVAVARYFEQDPLKQDSRLRRASLALGLNARAGKWQLSTRASLRYDGWSSWNDRQLDFPGAPILIDASANPFAAEGSNLLPVTVDTSFSSTRRTSLVFNASGPLLELPAGPLRVAFDSEILRLEQTGRARGLYFNSDSQLSRSELSLRAGLEVPITSRERGVLGEIGDLSGSMSLGITEVPGTGRLQQTAFGLTWQPSPRLRFQASVDRNRALPDVGQLGAPVTVSENVRYFDFLTGDTVDITQISGGNPYLLPERNLRRRLSSELLLWPLIDLRLTTEHVVVRQLDPIANLPPASLELLEAFPDRFTRNAAGVLSVADVRPINFQRRNSEQMRWGLSFLLKERGPEVRPGGPRLRADITHTINLSDDVFVRDGYPVVSLLRGGATGFGGALSRHQLTGALNFSDRVGGVRVSSSWRSSATLRVGRSGYEDVLTLYPLATIDVKAHVDLDKLWPNEPLTKKTRITLKVDNLLGDRQRVTDRAGVTGLGFQPAYRDPLGRNLLIELRRTF